VYVPSVQQQKGGIYCGLFAIAFALHLAVGDDLTKIIFEQEKMREHLLKCFMKKKLDPFPHSNVSAIPMNLCRPYCQPFTQILLYCNCRMPETYGNMVACDRCERWYHLKCVGNPTVKEEENWLYLTLALHNVT
jgi:hypothetical protein